MISIMDWAGMRMEWKGFFGVDSIAFSSHHVHPCDVLQK